MKMMLKRLVFPLILFILSLGTIKPLLFPGFFPMHDDTQPSRIYEMSQALKAGQFPVRWVGDLGYGYGYPLFNFYAPLPYYIGAIFNLAGSNAITATKLMFAFGVLLSGISMYLLVQELAGNIAAITSSILYLYAPYHAVNIFVRGAVGEYYAYAFLPLIFLGIIKIVKSQRVRPLTPLRSDPDLLKKGVGIGSLGLAGVLLSHNILGLITTYFLLTGLIIYSILIILKHKNQLTIYFLLFTIFLGFGLSAFFTVPAIAEKNYTKVDKLLLGGSDFRNNFVYIDQLWSSPWGFAGSAPGRADGMSFMIGKFHLLLAGAGITSALILWRKDQLKKFQFLAFSSQFIIFIVSVFFMLEQSRFLWEILPGFLFIQYPWRFLNYAIFSLSFMVAILFLNQKKIFQLFTSVIIIFAVFWFNLKYFVPHTYLPLKDEDYTGSANLRFKISKISDEYLPEYLNIPLKLEETPLHGLPEATGVKIIKETPTHKIYDLIAPETPETITITPYIAFFPGWKAYIDKKEVPLTQDHGRITTLVKLGHHRLEFRFTNTPIRSLSNTISILSLFLLVYVSLFLDKSWLQKIIRLK